MDQRDRELWQRAHDAAERFGKKYRLLPNGNIILREQQIKKEILDAHADFMSPYLDTTVYSALGAIVGLMVTAFLHPHETSLNVVPGMLIGGGLFLFGALGVNVLLLRRDRARNGKTDPR